MLAAYAGDPERCRKSAARERDPRTILYVPSRVASSKEIYILVTIENREL